jgi:hypothetical protein
VAQSLLLAEFPVEIFICLRKHTPPRNPPPYPKSNSKNYIENNQSLSALQKSLLHHTTKMKKYKEQNSPGGTSFNAMNFTFSMLASDIHTNQVSL